MMERVNLELLTENVKVSSWGKGKVLVVIDDIDVEDAIEQIDCKKIAEFVNLGELLECVEINDIVNSVNIDDLVSCLTESGYRLIEN